MALKDQPADQPGRVVVTDAQQRAAVALVQRRAEQLAGLAHMLRRSAEMKPMQPRASLGPIMSAALAAPTSGTAGYRMLNKGVDRGEIWLYGTIGSDWYGEGVTAKQFADDLRKLGAVKTIDVRINSDGGLVTDAQAIYSLLVEHKAEIAVHIDGIAASAASFVAMAGKTIAIAEGGFVMIHNARMGAYGEAADMERAAAILRTVNETIIAKYVARTGAAAADIKKWMDAETWFTGPEAVAAGFADTIVENLKVAASVGRPERFRHVPAALLPRRAAAVARIASLAR